MITKRFLVYKLNVNACYPVGIYMLKVKNRKSRARCEMCSNLTIKALERRRWRLSGVFFLLTLNIFHTLL